MSTIVDLPEIRDRGRRWSVEDYERFTEQGLLREKVELIRGVIIDKIPKSSLHCELAKELHDAIARALPPGFLVYQEAPLRLADSMPEPDVAVVRGVRGEFRHRRPATAALVIEVAVTSAARNRAYASMYAEAGVEEYWIVLALERVVEVYTAPLGGSYSQRRTVSADEVLSCSAVPNVSVPLSAVFDES